MFQLLRWKHLKLDFFLILFKHTSCQFKLKDCVQQKEAIFTKLAEILDINTNS